MQIEVPRARYIIFIPLIIIKFIYLRLFYLNYNWFIKKNTYKKILINSALYMRDLLSLN